jgi:hypothetical protein
VKRTGPIIAGFADGRSEQENTRKWIISETYKKESSTVNTLILLKVMWAMELSNNMFVLSVSY